VRRPVLLTVVVAGVALAAAGCGGSAAGSASPAAGGGTTAATTTSAAAPKFDPCAALPHDVLSSMGLTDQPKIDPDTGVCTWVVTGKDGVSASVGSYALGQRPDADNTHPTSTPLTIGSHKAVLLDSSTRGGWCGVDIGLTANTTFSLAVFALDSKTQSVACDHAKALANGAEPKLPASS
jgi:hypothetical protein